MLLYSLQLSCLLFSTHLQKLQQHAYIVLSIISSKNSLLRLCYIQQYLHSISNDFHARNIMTITLDQNKCLKNCSTQPFVFFSFFPLCDYFNFEIIITTLLPSIYYLQTCPYTIPCFLSNSWPLFLSIL